MRWQEELRSAIKSKESLELFLQCPLPDTSYPIFIPQNFARKIKILGVESVLWKQFVPHPEENLADGLEDPIGDQAYLKAPQLIHRYKNRALFLPTSHCPVSCRYCFRKNELISPVAFPPQLTETLNYLRDHPQIEEIIFSGGDPFVLSDEKIAYFLGEFEKISSIKYIRFHTRTPVILPSRITSQLISALTSSKRISIALHINHSLEIDEEVKEAIKKLNGFNLLSQTVLLKGINDQVPILKELIQNLIALDIRPYYLHHPDKAKGAMHFYLELETGRRIYQALRDIIPGWALFNYVVDIPHGHGKSNAFNPESWTFSGNLLGRDGNLYIY